MVIAQFLQTNLELACTIKEKLKEFQESLTESFRNTDRTKLRYLHDNFLETLNICGFH